MVFTKLSVQEKDAFFGLLDEYFESRPELFGQSRDGQGVTHGLAGTGVSTAAAASVVQRAFAANATGSSGSAGGASGKSNNPYAANMPNLNSADVAHAVTVGRVAAASLAFSGGGPGSQSQSQSQPQPQSQFQSLIQHAKPGPADPPSLPRRAASNAPASTSLERLGLPGSEVDKLVTRKTSVFSAFKKPATAGATIPPAFVTPKNTFGPPPVRRATSETTGSGGAVGTRSQGQATPEPEVAEGEWAEALYDYSSEDPGDLAIEAGTRVFVTAKSSDDWWTGQIEGQGREGLFPASYVKLL